MLSSLYTVVSFKKRLCFAEVKKESVEPGASS